MRFWALLPFLLSAAWALDLPPLPLPPLPLPKPPPAEGQPPPPPEEARDLERFYGAVTLNDGRTLLVGGVPLLGASPWTGVLAPGMVVEAEGNWAAGGFRAERLQVLSPNRFAYYRGPGAAVGQGGYAGVELWTVEGGGRVQTFALRAAPGGAEVRLVAYWDGRRFLALPPGLRPPPPGLPPGWVEGVGVYREGRIAWGRFRPFP
ncbi:hypothetical protein [Thermus thermamylovorans]|uniref:Uncharacterized protein n=1 Tax=Thermus thermamylovorans TaxID=2509362 RepID=A0A4Q9B600_9DEIN|nr:hypothetical protein [Thermus thermamylovorans]TBH21066.1 hypothetical protein ETP66_04645 [Thermus thermamylovorans]